MSELVWERFNHTHRLKETKLPKSRKLLAGVCLTALFTPGCSLGEMFESGPEKTIVPYDEVYTGTNQINPVEIDDRIFENVKVFVDPLLSNQRCQAELSNPNQYLKALLENLNFRDVSQELWQQLGSINIYCDWDSLNQDLNYRLGTQQSDRMHFYLEPDLNSNHAGEFFLVWGDKFSATILTLRAIYENHLLGDERLKIDSWLKEGYQAGEYQDITRLLNERCLADDACLRPHLHAAVGSLAKDLPAGLEEHYGYYFKNRQSLVSYNRQIFGLT